MTLDYFKIDMDNARIATGVIGISYIQHATLGSPPPRLGPHMEIDGKYNRCPYFRPMLVQTSQIGILLLVSKKIRYQGAFLY